MMTTNSWWLATELYHEIIECLVAALEAKDVYTKGHSTRVADLAYQLGQLAGLHGNALEDLHLAAHLHDIGKIGTPDRILNKKGPLLPDEFLIIKRHPVMGQQILAQSRQLLGIGKIVRHHHERWDGKGYPDGLQGAAIPFSSRIIAICDAIDAMTSARSYRAALSPDECIRELLTNRGKQFDPDLINLMVEHGYCGIWR
ncbi:MAG: HD-GYP domain-containing protein [Bacillota bacterium]|jgi:HD-GYP domain-containing protein (c-di-GMP phosphodiesterase class II)